MSNPHRKRIDKGPGEPGTRPHKWHRNPNYGVVTQSMGQRHRQHDKDQHLLRHPEGSASQGEESDDKWQDPKLVLRLGHPEGDHFLQECLDSAGLLDNSKRARYQKDKGDDISGRFDTLGRRHEKGHNALTLLLHLMVGPRNNCLLVFEGFTFKFTGWNNPSKDGEEEQKEGQKGENIREFAPCHGAICYNRELLAFFSCYTKLLRTGILRQTALGGLKRSIRQ